MNNLTLHAEAHIYFLPLLTKLFTGGNIILFCVPYEEIILCLIRNIECPEVSFALAEPYIMAEDCSFDNYNVLSNCFLTGEDVLM